MSQQESMSESQPLSDSSSMQDQTPFIQQLGSEQTTQWQQDVGLLPGLGSINDEEINMEQNEQLMRERQDRESSTAGNTARDADQSSSQHNAQEQGWWWAW